MGLSLLTYFINVFFLAFSVMADENGCDFYLAPSLVNGAGRGIFAGKPKEVHKVLEISPTLLVSKTFCTNWSLDNYIYAFDDHYSLVIFGMAMLYNHNIPNLVSASHVWDEKPVNCKVNSYEPYSVCTNVNYFSKKDLSIGEEIFTTYGTSDWFTFRGIPYVEADENSIAPRYKIEELQNVGFCLSDTYVAPSSILMAGRGLFARRNFKKGEVVTISPILILPKHEVIQASNDSPIINYCVASMISGDVAVFLMGVASMINHQMSSVANVEMQWHGFNEKDTAAQRKANETLSKDPIELEKSPFSPIDIAFIATKNIKANEEITMNYGEEWVNAWSIYLLNLIKSHVNNNQSPRIKFSYAIQPPDGFFPDHWKAKNCLGKFCR